MLPQNICIVMVINWSGQTKDVTQPKDIIFVTITMTNRKRLCVAVHLIFIAILLACLRFTESFILQPLAISTVRYSHKLIHSTT